MCGTAVLGGQAGGHGLSAVPCTDRPVEPALRQAEPVKGVKHEVRRAAHSARLRVEAGERGSHDQAVVFSLGLGMPLTHKGTPFPGRNQSGKGMKKGWQRPRPSGNRHVAFHQYPSRVPGSAQTKRACRSSGKPACSAVCSPTPLHRHIPTAHVRRFLLLVVSKPILVLRMILVRKVLRFAAVADHRLDPRPLE